MEYTPSFLDNLSADIQPSYIDCLTHHGIKGMHWGVRRYQNSDGSYTALGKKRRKSLQQHIIDWTIKRVQKAQRKEIERLKNLEAERVRRLESDPDYVDIRDRGNKVEKEWLDVSDKYMLSSKKANAAYKFRDRYWDDSTDENYDKAAKVSYEFGYDYGKKAGKELVRKHGNDAVNYFLDNWLQEGTYRTNSFTDQDKTRLRSLDASERFAKAMAEWEETHI